MKLNQNMISYYIYSKYQISKTINLCQVLTTKLRMFPILMGPPRMCPSCGCELQ